MLLLHVAGWGLVTTFLAYTSR